MSRSAIQRSILAVLLAVPPAPAIYSQISSPPRFEAASLKLSADQALMGTKPELSSGRIVWTTQLQYLISYAYDVDLGRVSFAGLGLGTIYSLNATFSPETPDSDLRLMLQALLADRFNMRAHRATKEVDGLALIIAKGGIKMTESESRPSDPGNSKSRTSGSDGYVTAIGAGRGITQIKAHGGSMRQLAQVSTN